MQIAYLSHRFGSAQVCGKMAGGNFEAMFIADALGLDFLNSIFTPVDTPIETIGTGEDFLEWLKSAKLVPAEVVDSFAKTAGPGELDAVATQARALREWFRNFVHRHKGKRLTVEALSELDPVNRILARDEEFGQIVARDRQAEHGQDIPSGLMWRTQRRWRSPEALLLPVARSMAELICADDFSHVKRCEGDSCTLLFIDRSRSHARRWCSMAVCGNRHKQQASRNRGRVRAPDVAG